MAAYQTAHTRYTAFSSFLSSAELLPYCGSPVEGRGFLGDDDGLFACVATEADLLRAFGDVGLLDAWGRQGNHRVWLQTSNPQPRCHVLSVFTEFEGASELLLHAIVWLEFTRFAETGKTLPSLCVEHLRLQNPRAVRPEQGLLPGQDFPGSGLFPQVFALARWLGLRTGAACITEVPEYFHTSWMFSRFFSYVDPEMRSYYAGMVRDLLPGKAAFTDVAEVSRAFEDGRIRFNGEPWGWPTELQACPIEKGVDFPRDFAECTGFFSRAEA